MRQGGNQRRQRSGRPNNGGGGGGKRPFNFGPNRSFESNGPGVKLRGTPAQVFDKYLALARDAFSAGDRIAAENYYQHAEHYFRLHAAFTARRESDRVNNPNDGQNQNQNRGRGGPGDEFGYGEYDSPEVIDAPGRGQGGDGSMGALADSDPNSDGSRGNGQNR